MATAGILWVALRALRAPLNPDAIDTPNWRALAQAHNQALTTPPTAFRHHA